MRTLHISPEIRGALADSLDSKQEEEEEGAEGSSVGTGTTPSSAALSCCKMPFL